MHLWLVGLSASGKSSGGRGAAAALGVDFVDTDAVVEQRMGCSIAEFWGERGEEAFRDLEAAVVAEVAAGPPAVVAAGGGVVLRDANVGAMRRSGVVVWLEAPPEELAGRIEGPGRPLLDGHEPAARLAELLAERGERYAAAAHLRVDTLGRTRRDVVGELARLWPSRIAVGDESEVFIGHGLADLPVLPEREGRERVVVLTQPGARPVADRVAAGAGQPTPILELPDGEAAKTLAVIEDVYRWLAGQGLHRGDTVVAVGGGSLTDAAGFAAATYLRGIEAVYVPTTLLGAVDAAVGGKTGVNLGGKNLVGAFRHPSRVVIDVDVLEALPDDLWREGAAEAVKAGFVGDPALVELFEQHGRGAPLGEVVRRAVAVKTAVVTEDFTEGGRRAVLNYGHTVGHAVEIAAGLRHGDAVGVGMVAAGLVSEARCGFSDRARHDAVLARLGLPAAATADAAEVRRLLARDKKRDAAGLRMVLLRAIGDPTVRHVDSATVETALAAVLEG